MAAICQSNPLKQFVSKSDQLRGSGFGPVSRAVNNGAVAARTSSLEQQFLLPTETQNGFMRVDAPDVRSLGARAGPTDSWVRQFSSMQLDDPLAFSNEYKKFYDSYERQHQQQQQQQQQHHPLVADLHANMRELPRGMLERRNVVLSNVNMPPRNMDEYFDEEFESLEEEIQEENSSIASPLESTKVDMDLSMGLDEEQQKFQQAASDIYSCLASRPNNKSHSSSNNIQMETKMQRSKFLGLMRSISDGIVTLKKNDEHDVTYNELYSPTTGEVVGNEYFRIQEETHKPTH